MHITNSSMASELLKLKDDLYVPVDFETNHAYYADAEGTKKYSGITSVIGVLAKPALIPWAARMAADYVSDALREDIQRGYDREYFDQVILESKSAHTKKKEDAATHGTDAHALVEKYIKNCIEIDDGRPLSMGNDYSGYDDSYETIRPFIEWAADNVDHFLFSERRMSNIDLFIAGTADFGAVMKDGKTLIGDFKTSSGVYGIDYFLQCAAYKLIAEKEGDKPYDGCVIVRFGKDGTFDVHYRYNNDVDEGAFMACLTLYRAQNSFVKPKR